MSDKEKEFDDVVDILRVKYTGDTRWLDSELVNETIKAFKQASINKKTKYETKENIT